MAEDQIIETDCCGNCCFWAEGTIGDYCSAAIELDCGGSEIYGDPFMASPDFCPLKKGDVIVRLKSILGGAESPPGERGRAQSRRPE